MKRILLVMWVLLLGISIQAQTVTLAVKSDSPLQAQIESLGVCDHLIITGELTEADFTLLNSTTYPRLADVTTLDLSGATIGGISTMSGMRMGGVKYLRLPSNIQSTTEMASLNSQMPALEMAFSFSDLETTTPKVFIHSFKSNSRVAAFAALNCEATLNNAVYATLSGDYGDDDLIAHNGNLPFMKAAVWDFTGASFDNCRVNASVVNRGPYYASDDPFQEHGTVSLSSSYPSNAFYYFKDYATKVVSIKLPTGISELPPACMTRLGEENGPNYKLVYNKTSEELAAIEAELSEIMTAQNKSYTSGTYYPIDELVVPDNIVTVGYECCVQSVIRSVQLGTGVKEVQGGAFKLNYFLNNLDCKTGISDCRLGDQAFNECNNMKHIVLSEGIISLGANCFNNSQNLESIRLPETLTSIGNYCFMNGHALSSITIPAGVHKIGMGAFTLTALTDIYLMAEDPADVPIIYTAGSDWGDTKSTFAKNTMENNNTLEWDANGNFNGKDKEIGKMTFDEAAAAYFAYGRRMAVLHSSPKIADYVLTEISSHYGCVSTDGYGIPVMSTGDSGKRANAMGLQDMGSPGQGIYTQYGWAQFLLQKEFNPDHPEVFTKEYDDVWYTMCFPFDLTDEQLATAFNEGFNIADFSGVEIKEETEDNPKTMILHFNTVAKTTYKDAEENVYTVTGREVDGKFEYNIYQRGGDTYNHVNVGESGENYKTKTFAKDGNANNGIVEIDGILATAGHPYMIHPNTGTNSGMPLTRCHFSGITWKPADQWETIFDAEKRVVDLGDAKGTMGESLKDCTPSEDNYLQAAYPEHNGEKYTFIGNWKQYRTDLEIPASLEMPTVENGKLAATPLVTQYTDLYPQGPAMPEARKAVLQAVGEKMTTAPTPPTEVENPANDKQTYPDKLQTFYYTTGAFNNNNNKWGEAILGCSFSNVADGPHDWGGWVYQWINGSANAFSTYFGITSGNVPVDQFNESMFNELKAKCLQFHDALESYNSYLEDLAQYQENIEAYEANVAAWTTYETEHAQEESKYQDALTTYTQKISQWYAAVASVEASNRNTLAQWEQDMKPYQVLIPKYSYFLGRRGRGWPKFYREMADDTRTNPTGGFWTMYTAIVTPNQDALDGLEAELDGNTQQAKGSDMLFDEGFFNLLEEMNQGGIATTIEKAKKEGKTIKYMDIVVSVDGQIIRSGSTSIEGLPRGLYIINGKKYYVK